MCAHAAAELELDWKTDADGPRTISPDALADALFDTVDVWSPYATVESYVALLALLHGCIFEEKEAGGETTTRLRGARPGTAVGALGLLMSKADGVIVPATITQTFLDFAGPVEWAAAQKQHGRARTRTRSGAGSVAANPAVPTGSPVRVQPRALRHAVPNAGSRRSGSASLAAGSHSPPADARRLRSLGRARPPARAHPPTPAGGRDRYVVTNMSSRNAYSSEWATVLGGDAPGGDAAVAAVTSALAALREPEEGAEQRRPLVASNLLARVRALRTRRSDAGAEPPADADMSGAAPDAHDVIAAAVDGMLSTVLRRRSRARQSVLAVPDGGLAGPQSGRESPVLPSTDQPAEGQPAVAPALDGSSTGGVGRKASPGRLTLARDAPPFTTIAVPPTVSANDTAYGAEPAAAMQSVLATGRHESSASATDGMMTSVAHSVSSASSVASAVGACLELTAPEAAPSPSKERRHRRRAQSRADLEDAPFEGAGRAPWTRGVLRVRRVSPLPRPTSPLGLSAAPAVLAATIKARERPASAMSRYARRPAEPDRLLGASASSFWLQSLAPLLDRPRSASVRDRLGGVPADSGLTPLVLPTHVAGAAGPLPLLAVFPASLAPNDAVAMLEASRIPAAGAFSASTKVLKGVSCAEPVGEARRSSPRFAFANVVLAAMDGLRADGKLPARARPFDAASRWRLLRDALHARPQLVLRHEAVVLDAPARAVAAPLGACRCAPRAGAGRRRPRVGAYSGPSAAGGPGARSQRGATRSGMAAGAVCPWRPCRVSRRRRLDGAARLEDQRSGGAH